VSDKALSRLYRECTVFVFTSLYEGFGLLVLEGMASEAYVVVRDASVMAEVAGEAGMLVDTFDATSLAYGIAQFLKDPPERRQLGELAFQRTPLSSIERMATLTYRSYCLAMG